MGCFDYDCECGGETCTHKGFQDNEATVIIEVPLSDGTNVYLKGEYEEYGYVTIKVNDQEYEFYLEEFKSYFLGWFQDKEDIKKCLLAKRVWTSEETLEVYDRKRDLYVEKKVKRKCFEQTEYSVSDLTPEIVNKCLCVNTVVELPTYQEILTEKQEKLKKQIEELQSQLKQSKEQLKEIKTKLKEVTKKPKAKKAVGAGEE